MGRLQNSSFFFLSSYSKAQRAESVDRTSMRDRSKNTPAVWWCLMIFLVFSPVILILNGSVAVYANLRDAFWLALVDIKTNP